ncbi:glutamyl-tRNA synthetase [Desulfatibacillum alkenivorans DSM 16219]|jgi:glutamyl-tRNA synthetase|uniref:Glutamate--tRNA ligase n=1 Tax=Desulfatibacillum alkenivorans DSM 16219 TaxID=1121393 RepID=A0A1M6XZ20_9BACT|nr:glutamate--tRNA ligase [Desulfatibacillum alkenivorans]SHL11139.1 glutamyl-tRNA synthetase [Desulfatibacillum alkenivorans DSM 16219]
MDKIITRFPPSPTGALHIGGARTALFNWLYARRTGGTFVLRLEDTDKARSTQESVDAIFQGLEWLGIDWDEGPFYQSKRTEIYQEHIQKLLDEGAAYYCTCTPEELDEKRKAAMARGDKPKYDGTCREKGLEKCEGAVVRLKAPQTGKTVFEDKVKGTIAFDNQELDDLIIARSDGSPTYHLAVVVDDITMGVNTIIRGDDHVSNTPRQILLYNALGYPVPTFAHVPMVLGADKKRLSKRHGATSVVEYKDMGILPEAMINYLARMGWSHGDQEFFTVDELKQVFTLENIGKSAGVFDPARLLDLNGDHIRAAKDKRLAPLFIEQLAKLGVETEEGEYLYQVMETLKPRAKTTIELAEKALFYYADDIEYDPKAANKCLKAEAVPALELLIEKLEAADVSDEKQVEEAFVQVMEATGLKMGKIAQPVRVALTGQTASPGIFEIVQILGMDKVKARLAKAMDYIRQQEA